MTTDTLTHLEACRGQLRRVLGRFDWENNLQQLWQITTYRNGTPVNVREEWRNIPDVTAATAAPDQDPQLHIPV